MSHIHTKFQNQSLLAEGERVSDEQLVEEAKQLAFARSIKRADRRSFLTKMGFAGAAAVGSTALMGGLSGCSDNGTITTTTGAPSVFDVLNFALNLEYLEASFYLYITTGSGLATANQGTSPGTVTGGAKYTFVNPAVAAVANQLATDENAHVILLQQSIAALGGTAVGLPNLNLAANGAVTSDQSFLALARQLETVGVSAYAGGAQYLAPNTTALLYGAQILDTESQHEGYLRQLCIALGVTSAAVDSLDTPPTTTAIFNTSPTTGLNPVRTTSQVLQIVYAAAGKTGVSSGGFFPNGLNGTIRTS